MHRKKEVDQIKSKGKDESSCLCCCCSGGESKYEKKKIRFIVKVQKQEADEVFLLALIPKLPAELGFGFEDGHGEPRKAVRIFNML